MKAIFCTECRDVLALRGERRTCACGRSAGKYFDRLNAEISGPCLALAFLNREFFGVVAEQLSLGDSDEKLTIPPYERHTKGREFMAIVVPESARSVRRLDAGPYSPPLRPEAAAGRKVQSLASLRDEMKAVARSERPAPADAATPSTNVRDVLIVGGFPDDIVAAIEAAEYGKVLDYFDRDMIAHPERARSLDPALIESLWSLLAEVDVDLDAPIEPDEDPGTKD
jgi:hypothetical protein